MLNRTRRFAKSFISKSPPPAPLHVCRESRFEGLSVYVPFFKTDFSPTYTYLSFEQDILHCMDNLLEYIGEKEINGVQRMVLEIKDAAYFGFFHMDVLKQMVKLKELDLLMQDGEIHSRNRGRRYVGTVTDDFAHARYKDPGWVCPRVRILDTDTKEELTVIAGGALLPGWKEG
jgi:hypothetical protein